MHRWTHPLVKQKSADGWAGVEHETCQYIYIHTYKYMISHHNVDIDLPPWRRKKVIRAPDLERS